MCTNLNPSFQVYEINPCTKLIYFTEGNRAKIGDFCHGSQKGTSLHTPSPYPPPNHPLSPSPITPPSLSSAVILLHPCPLCACVRLCVCEKGTAGCREGRERRRVIGIFCFCFYRSAIAGGMDVVSVLRATLTLYPLSPPPPVRIDV